MVLLARLSCKKTCIPFSVSNKLNFQEINIEDYFVGPDCPGHISRYFCKSLKTLDGIVVKLASLIRRTQHAKPIVGDIYEFWPSLVEPVSGFKKLLF